MSEPDKIEFILPGNKTPVTSRFPNGLSCAVMDSPLLRLYNEDVKECGKLNMSAKVSIQHTKLAKTPMKGAATTSRKEGLSKRRCSFFPKAVSFANSALNGSVMKDPSYKPDLYQASYYQQCFLEKGCIGRGSFASVTKVKRVKDNSWFAIKSIKRPNKHCLVEVKNHEMIPEHSNVVKFFCAWEERLLYIQLELCYFDLDVLKSFLESVENTTVLWYAFIDSLKGLVHLHNYVIHLDIKPRNILLGYDYHFKIGDLGCSMACADDYQGFIPDGVWTAPELKGVVAEDEKFTTKADVYSLGMTFSHFTNCTPGTEMQDFENVKTKQDPNMINILNEMTLDYKQRPDAATVLSSQIVKKHEEICNESNIKVHLESTLKNVIEDEELNLEEDHVERHYALEREKQIIAIGSEMNHSDVEMMEYNDEMEYEDEMVKNIQNSSPSTPRLTNSFHSFSHDTVPKRLTFDDSD